MQVKVTGRHVRVPPALRAYAEDRALGLEHFSDHVTHVEVVLAREGDRRTAEMIIHTERGPIIVGHATDGRFRTALDVVTDKVARQLVKHKERRVTRVSHRVPHRRTASQRIAPAAARTETEESS